VGELNDESFFLFCVVLDHDPFYDTLHTTSLFHRSHSSLQAAKNLLPPS